jgi:hypothetical protein
LFYVIFTILLGLEVLDDPPGGYFSSKEPADDVSNFLVGSISAETGSANVDTERPDPSPQKVDPAPSIPAFDTTIKRDHPDPPQKEDTPPSIKTFDTMAIDRHDPRDGYSIVAVETPSTNLVSSNSTFLQKGKSVASETLSIFKKRDIRQLTALS